MNTSRAAGRRERKGLHRVGPACGGKTRPIDPVELKSFGGLNFAARTALRQLSGRNLRREWESAPLFLFGPQRA